MDILNMSLEQKIGQMIVAGFEDSFVDEHVTKLIKDYHVGNVIYFTRNVKSAKQLYNINKELQNMAINENGQPLFITIDQEGGMVTRIPNEATFFLGNMALSAGGNEEDAYMAGKYCGQELKALGINMNLAPVLDVNNNPNNPVIGVRSYGGNPKRVANLGTAYIKGLQENGIIATGKHFPGHGDTSVDSHLDLSSVNHNRDRLESVELYPFKMAIKSGLKAIMSAHIIFPAYESEKLPATLSYKVLTGLLREELGFKGLITTDCMQMKAIDKYFTTEKAAVMAVKAGADLIFVCHTLEKQVAAIDNLINAVKSGEISEKRIDESVERIIEYKNSIHIDEFMKSSFEDAEDIIGNRTHKEFVQNLSERSITVFKNDRILPLKKAEKIYIVSVKSTALTGADDSIGSLDISKGIKDSYDFCDTDIIDVNPSDETIKNVTEKSKKADKVVILTYNAHLNKEQIEMVKKVYDGNKKVAVIAMRNPYDFNELGFVPCMVSAYEYTSLSIKSIAKLLKGEIKGEGICPVSLSI